MALCVVYARVHLEIRALSVTFMTMALKRSPFQPLLAALWLCTLAFGGLLPILMPAQANAETGADPAALLEKLQDADPMDARQIERNLERLWSQSGSVAMNLLLERGRRAMEAEDFGAAIEHFTALTDHAPDFAEGWHQRAMAYFRTERYGPALDDLGRALVLNPQNYNAMFGLGVLMQEFGQLVRAEAAFQRVLELNPTHENATNALRRLERQGIGRTL